MDTTELEFAAMQIASQEGGVHAELLAADQNVEAPGEVALGLAAGALEAARRGLLEPVTST